MKLNALQWLWLVVTGIFFGALVLDIAGVINVQGRLLIVIPITLTLVGWLVGPSLKELSKANRRG